MYVAITSRFKIGPALWPMAGSDYTTSADYALIRSSQTNMRIVHDFEKSATRWGLVMWYASICDFFICNVRKPHNEILACQNLRGIAMTYPLLTWREPCNQLCEGIPPTAGVHGQCLLTSKELTSKVKTIRDARLVVIHRKPWIIHGLGGLSERK